MFNLKDYMKEGESGKFFWRNVYGAPLDCHGQVTDTMNANPEAASTWKGRILCQVVAEKTEKPVCLRRKVDLKTLQAAQPYMVYREFDIIAEVSLGIALPSEDEYTVKI